MTPELMAVMTRNSGLATRIDALAAGLDDERLRRAVRVGELVVVRRGVYTHRELWHAVDDRRGRPLLRALAASLTMTLPHVLSHDSAAHLLDLPFLTPRKPLVHVTRDRVIGSRTHHGVKHHGARHRAEDVVEVGGVAALSLARTAVDLAREHGLEIGTSACDAAMRLGVSRAELERVVGEMTCWPHVTAARQSAALADPGGENPGETRGRILVTELGFGRPDTQFPVMTRSGLVWCDLRIGRHLFEFHGRIKYRLVRDGGVAERPIDEVLVAERRRADEVREQGLGLSRIMWHDLGGDARRRALARLRAEVQQTFLLHGRQLPAHLAEFADRMAEARRRRITRQWTPPDVLLGGFSG